MNVNISPAHSCWCQATIFDEKQACMRNHQTLISASSFDTVSGDQNVARQANLMLRRAALAEPQLLMKECLSFGVEGSVRSLSETLVELPSLMTVSSLVKR